MRTLITVLIIVMITPRLAMAQHPASATAPTDLPASVSAELAGTVLSAKSAKEIVKDFLSQVRSGLYPEKAGAYMADTVLAHQINSENPVTVRRTPANYTAHVREFLTLFGRFEFEITELLAEDDKVYARWIQKGIHQSAIDNYEPTGLPLIEFSSAVYRVEKEKIVEYWIQSDRQGMEAQLKKNAVLASGAGKEGH